MEKDARIVLKKNAEAKDIRYWQSKSQEERLDAVQYLRMQWVEKFHNWKLYDESRKGLRRIYRIVKQE